jgi:hypothetical protein
MITINWGRYEPDFDREHGNPAAGGSRGPGGGVRRRDWERANVIGLIAVTASGQGAAKRGRT